MIDTHTHIYGREFSSDINEVIQRAKEAGVTKILLPNTDEESLSEIDSLCIDYSGFCFPMYGLHPTEIVLSRWKEQLDSIISHAETNIARCIACGEIGFDFHYGRESEEVQYICLKTQVGWAISHHLPISFHVRDAYPEFINFLKQFSPNDIKGSLHCLSGNSAEALFIRDNYQNLQFGIGGTITYKNSKNPSMIKEGIIPLDRIVLETDAPYLAPVPLRGKRNEPSYLTHVVSFIAEITNRSYDDIVSITDSNAKHIFST